MPEWNGVDIDVIEGSYIQMVTEDVDTTNDNNNVGN